MKLPPSPDNVNFELLSTRSQRNQCFYFVEKKCHIHLEEIRMVLFKAIICPHSHAKYGYPGLLHKRVSKEVSWGQIGGMWSLFCYLWQTAGSWESQAPQSIFCTFCPLFQSILLLFLGWGTIIKSPPMNCDNFDFDFVTNGFESKKPDGKTISNLKSKIYFHKNVASDSERN